MGTEAVVVAKVSNPTELVSRARASRHVEIALLTAVVATLGLPLYYHWNRILAKFQNRRQRAISADEASTRS